MTTNTDEYERTSLLTTARFGGAVACCLALEFLGGAAILGGLTATIGVSTGVTYVTVIGVGGVLTALLASRYQE